MLARILSSGRELRLSFSMRSQAGQELKVSRCFSEDTAEYPPDLGKAVGVVGPGPQPMTCVLPSRSLFDLGGCRRLTEPVLADERFKHIEGSGHRTSQILTAAARAKILAAMPLS